MSSSEGYEILLSLGPLDGLPQADVCTSLPFQLFHREPSYESVSTHVKGDYISEDLEIGSLSELDWQKRTDGKDMLGSQTKLVGASDGKSTDYQSHSLTEWETQSSVSNPYYQQAGGLEHGGSAVGIVFQGNCDMVDRYSIGIHLVINVLSTVLLGASNYIMQTLCAPTRDEVDRAHEKGIWLDIGIQSLRNLKYVSRLKRILWIALSLSSIPLHFFYNSSFFSTISAEEYMVVPAKGPDLQTITLNVEGRYNWTCGDGGCPANVSQTELSQWDVLSAAECIQAYATDFVSDRATVVPIVGDFISNASTLTVELHSFWSGTDGEIQPYGWICSGMDNYQAQLLCSSRWRNINPSNWTYADFSGYSDDTPTPVKVNYCLSQPIVPKCQLKFNLPLLAIVIAFNIVKVGCIVFAAIKLKDNALVTIGDAIASFTSNPDLYTREMCLASSGTFDVQEVGEDVYLDGQEIGEDVYLEYQPQRIRWVNAATRHHWITTALLFAVAIFIILSLLIIALLLWSVSLGATGLWQLGIGKPHALTVIMGWSLSNLGYAALLVPVLISNSPQLILSVIYIVFNILCIKMLLAREWSSYARSRKPLRVSSPRGAQRSTYFLQIPYRFGLPLMGYSALLHWLVSQSLFLVQVTYYLDDSSEGSAIGSCGYSPIGMIFTIIIGATLILGVFVTGFFTHLSGKMPLVRGCSAAISASCHPPIPDGSDSLKPMKWGAVVGAEGDGKRTVGHSANLRDKQYAHLLYDANFMSNAAPVQFQLMTSLLSHQSRQQCKSCAPKTTSYPAKRHRLQAKGGEEDGKAAEAGILQECARQMMFISRSLDGSAEAKLYIDDGLFLCDSMVDSAKRLFQPSPVQPSYTSLSTLDINESFSSEGYTRNSSLSQSGGHRRNTSDSQTTSISLQDKKPYRSGWNFFIDGIRTVKSIKSQLPTGWRFGAWLATFQAWLVLLANIFILIWSAMESGGSAIGIVFQGDCDKVAQYSTGIHLVINVLSTMLLGASNYMMQTLCAPTRDDIDRAHEKGIWLDIGLQSIRNLRYINRVKRDLWIALAISSIPLHLLYNSSFFSTISASEYDVATATGPDLRSMTPNADGRYNWACEYPSDCPEYATATELSQWDVLYPTECLHDYATDFVSARANVVLVAGSYGSSGLLISDQGVSYRNGASTGHELGDPSFELDFTSLQWAEAVGGQLLSQSASHSKMPTQLQSTAFSDAVKIKDNALVTIGDAIASFTKDPDIHTRGMSLASSDIFDGRDISERLCSEYQPRKIRWLNAASKRHWITTVLLFADAISIILGFLIYAVNALKIFHGVTGFSGLIQLGLGKPHFQNIISWSLPSVGYTAILTSVLISNSPQLILSMIYLVFNSLCTKMFLAREWASYAHSRKPLRVSSPQGKQRSTYFLQIPYRFGIPLMAYSALLHWLVSQSIFLVQVVYYYDSEVTGPPTSSCGYSPLSMVLSIVVGTILILSTFVVGFFTHLNGDMPLVGSCSAAISASCHPPIPDGSDSLKPMKWGAVVGAEDDDDRKRTVTGHVCFSSGTVLKPIPGCYYA
ncbi:hypothetical protein D9757_009779 [Collybiopsis confluens]|uniref:DUF6536 domain-containing protein n=1 Tax=Collybiopsis confluens TaxID=2823264 RepID=A0A8H5HFS7_9AGAR|nr:hypothetical protein D9757_009779 [Collybiopsis confluens]